MVFAMSNHSMNAGPTAWKGNQIEDTVYVLPSPLRWDECLWIDRKNAPVELFVIINSVNKFNYRIWMDIHEMAERNMPARQQK